MFLFLAVTCMYSAQASPSAQGFTEVSWVRLTSSSLLLYLCPFFSCVRGLVQADVVFRAQLPTVSVANNSLSENGLNVHHKTIPSLSGTKQTSPTLLVSGKTSEMLLLDVECLYL